MFELFTVNALYKFLAYILTYLVILTYEHIIFKFTEKKLEVELHKIDA